MTTHGILNKKYKYIKQKNIKTKQIFFSKQKIEKTKEVASG
jgi:hypothetical protein